MKVLYTKIKAVVQKIWSWLLRKLPALERVLAYIPSRLPVGIHEAEVWAESIIRMAKLPQNDSMKFALCVKILHLGEAESYKAKEFFIRCLHKAAANQVVSQIINDLKAKQQEAINKQNAEATAPAVANEQSQAV